MGQQLLQFVLKGHQQRCVPVTVSQRRVAGDRRVLGGVRRVFIGYIER